MVQTDRCYAFFLQMLHNGIGKRMFGFHLAGQKNGQFCFGWIFCPNNCPDPGFTLRQRTGFIQNYAIHFAHIFKGISVFDQYMVLRCFTNTHHQCRRCCQAQGTGTSDHQNRDGSQQGQRKIRTSANDHPENKRYYRNDYHNRDKNGTDFVHQFLNGSLASLGLPDHPDNMCQHGAAAYL